MERIHGFPPVAGPGARCLVLGSMPSRQSLAEARYYAHPRNAFWPIMGKLLGFDPASPYPERTAALIAAGIALWDVIASCKRASSLDSDIVETSITVNDFAAFFAAHPLLVAVYFNGLKAEQSYRKHVAPSLPGTAPPGTRLPSTSPANAGMSFSRKLEAWRAVAGGA